jgi:phosphodiesterase/alkaline phosphatase D-like protein
VRDCPRRRRFQAGIVATAVLIAASALAQTVTRGPFIQNPDAVSTTMTLVWWTDVADDSTVEYGLTPALGLTASVLQAGTCEVGAAGTCHVVPLAALLTGTRYYYRLRTNGTIVQTTNYFTTLRAPVDPGDFFFTVVGDWGDSSGGEANVASLQDAADPQIIMTVGDNVYPNGTQSEWDTKSPMQRIPFFPALGNHDVNSVGPANWASSAQIKMFLLPRNGTEQER